MNRKVLFPSREDIAALKEKSDEWWYATMLELGFCGTKLSHKERDEIIRRSAGAAENSYSNIAHRYQGQSPEAVAQAFGLDIRQINKDDLFGNEHILALFKPEESAILLCEETIAALLRYLDESGLNKTMGEYNIRQTALWHELFHAIEERTPGIYTRSKMLKRKFLFFDVLRGFDSAGEIGAIHFSKLMSGISFSPCLYEYLLISMNGRAIPDAWKLNHAN